LYKFADNQKKLLLAVASGLLLTGSFPKFGSVWIAWVALIPLLMAIRNLPAGRRFRLGLAAGIVHYLTLTYWLIITMQTYGGLNVWASIGILCLLSVYLALYVGAFSLFLGLLAPTAPGCLAAAPALWVILEFIRAKAITGFPWELLGYSQYRALQIIQISDIFGVYGVSFLVVAVNTGLFLVWLAVKNRQWQGRQVTRKSAFAAGICILLLTGAALVYGHLRMAEVRRNAKEAKQIKAAVIQGNIPQDVKWDPEFKISTVDTYLRLSRETSHTESPDLIVWPETATPFYFQRAMELTRRVEEGIKGKGAFFIIGSPSAIEDGAGYHLYNSAYLMTPEGTVGGRYDKQHLVPFGEYVPLGRWLTFVEKLVSGMVDFTPGRSGVSMPWANGKVGVQICYEVIFPYLARRAVQNGADLLVYLSNDAWYGTSSAPHQLFSMAILRAVETRRSVVRAANTGISGFVDPTGRIIGHTGLFEEATLTAEVPILKKKTIYARWGDWFPAVCGIWIAACIIHYIAFTRRKTSPA
jgi:apolipoprotein N-acyltransferase